MTGATDGIGKAMALEFARKGLKVLLVSRTLKPKAKPDGRSLQETKAFIEEKTKGKATVEMLQIDFGEFDDFAAASGCFFSLIFVGVRFRFNWAGQLRGIQHLPQQLRDNGSLTW